MSARWHETGVGTRRCDDGVWRQDGGTDEFVDPTDICDKGEEDAIDAFLACVNHNDASSGMTTYLDEPAETAGPNPIDEEPLSAWEMELLVREATIEGLERKLVEAEKGLNTLLRGAVVVRGKTARVTQIRKEIARLKRELEDERATQQFPRPGPVKVLFRRTRSDAIRARGPRDPNKVC